MRKRKRNRAAGELEGGKTRLESDRLLSLSQKNGTGFWDKLSPAAVIRQRGSGCIESHRKTKNSITIRYANASVIGASASAAVSRQSSSRSTVPS